MPISIEPPRMRVELKGITVRLGVGSYKHKELYDLLKSSSILVTFVYVVYELWNSKS